MTKSIYIELIPKDNFDFVKVMVDYSNGRPVDLSGCKMFHVPNPIFHLKSEFMEYVVKHGFTSFSQMQLILEDLTTPSTPPEQVEALLIRYLTNIGIDNELIIIDPYFYPLRMDDSYPEMIAKIISSFTPTLTNLRIVTAANNRAFSIETKNLVENKIRQCCPSVNLFHTTSNDLHDRFWISNKREKGIITGTSLNGLGKKYSVIDFLCEEDVKAIISDFSQQQLI